MLVGHVGRTQHWVAEIIERRITDPKLPTEMALVVQGRPATSGQGRGGTTFTASEFPSLEEVERGRRDRRPGKFFKEVREAVSDRGGGVRSRGEAARMGAAPR
jgi:hypothetical protein